MEPSRTIFSACRIFCLLCLTLTFAPCALADDDLPAAVRADILGRKIIKEIASKQHEAALADIAIYKGLGVSVPPSLLWEEAKLADTTGDCLRSFHAVKDFLQGVERSNSHYTEALDLYTKCEGSPAVAAEAVRVEKLEALRKKSGSCDAIVKQLRNAETAVEACANDANCNTSRLKILETTAARLDQSSDDCITEYNKMYKMSASQ